LLGVIYFKKRKEDAQLKNPLTEIASTAIGIKE